MSPVATPPGFFILEPQALVHNRVMQVPTDVHGLTRDWLSSETDSVVAKLWRGDAREIDFYLRFAPHRPSAPPNVLWRLRPADAATRREATPGVR